MPRTHKKVSDAPRPACLGPGGSAFRVHETLRMLGGRWKLDILFLLFRHRDTQVLRARTVDPGRVTEDAGVASARARKRRHRATRGAPGGATTRRLQPHEARRGSENLCFVECETGTDEGLRSQWFSCTGKSCRKTPRPSLTQASSHLVPQQYESCAQTAVAQASQLLVSFFPVAQSVVRAGAAGVAARAGISAAGRCARIGARRRSGRADDGASVRSAVARRTVPARAGGADLCIALAASVAARGHVVEVGGVGVGERVGLRGLAETREERRDDRRCGARAAVHFPARCAGRRAAVGVVDRDAVPDRRPRRCRLRRASSKPTSTRIPSDRSPG